MKKILFCIALSFSTALMSQSDFNQWSIGMNFGGIGGASPVVAEGMKLTNSPTFGGHLRYMLNDRFGIMGTAQYGIFSFPTDDLSSNYLGLKLHGVANLGNILNFNSFSDNFGLLFHVGTGLSGLWQSDYPFPDDNESPLFNNVDEKIPISFGLTPQVKIGNNLALFTDLTYNTHFKQDRTYDYSESITNSSRTGHFFTITFGATYYIGKKEKHAEWIHFTKHEEVLIAEKEEVPIIETPVKPPVDVKEVEDMNTSLEFAIDGTEIDFKGPVTSVDILFKKNADNPSGNNFKSYLPELKANFKITNQQFNHSLFSEDGSVFFGMTDEPRPVVVPIEYLSIPNNSFYTGFGANNGKGVDVSANASVLTTVFTAPLAEGSIPSDSRVYMADLEITFNRPVTNPILHITGMGGSFLRQAYSAELDYVTSNNPLVFKKLSGNKSLSITERQINHANKNIGFKAEDDASGSILLSGKNIEKVVLRVYIRGNGEGRWSLNRNSLHGEAFLLGISLGEADLNVTCKVEPQNPEFGSIVVFTIDALNNGPSVNTNVIVDGLLPSGYSFVSADTKAGKFNDKTGVWEIGNLAGGEKQTLIIKATVNESGNHDKTVTISGDLGEPSTDSNIVKLSVKPVQPKKPEPVITEEIKQVFIQALQGIQFDVGRSTIKSASFPILNQIVNIMVENPTFNLKITGHTDSSGSFDSNMTLSKNRALAVKNYLIEKGIDGSRLTSDGVGPKVPVADNNTATGRAQNRRVEFEIVL